MSSLFSSIQGVTQKFLDNCYKTQITSYMDMIYFYSSKYIPPWSIHLFAHSLNFFMPSRKAVFEVLLSSLVTAHWISSTAWKCRPFKENFKFGEEKIVGRCKIWRVKWVMENSNVPVRPKLYICSVMRLRVVVKKKPLTGLEFGRSNSSDSLLVADPKHPRRTLHLLSALQGQTLDELHLLRRKMQLTSSSFAIFEIVVSLVL